jgi:3-oxoacyl-[acyl-carrier-protein] synthase-3
MAYVDIKNVKIAGIAACVPERVEDNRSYSFLSAEEIEKYIAAIGVERRYCAIHDGSICTSDLCYKASEKLISDLKWDKSEIDLLVFVSHTQDYKLPATACVLQDRLNLSVNCMSFDVSFGCSGFVYGLSIVASLLSMGNMRKVLLMVGNTQSVYASPEDKTLALLFGDAGAVMALEYNSKHADLLQFSLHSDGSGKEFLIVPDGGCRNPLNTQSFIMEEFEDGIKRTRLHEKMDGIEVFTFGFSQIPKSFRELYEHFSINPENIDYLCLHQANKFLCEKIRKKLKFPIEKTPYNIAEFGNTSGTSIPLLMVTNLKKELETKPLNLLCAGFGVGLSWGTARITTDKIVVSELLFL